MKVFVWGYISGATHNYHDEGGLVIFAASLDRARALLRDRVPDGNFWDAELNAPRATCEAFTEPPDYVRSCYGSDERVFVFPDAGCC